MAISGQIGHEDTERDDADAFEPFDADGGLVLAVRLPGSAEDFAHPLGWDQLSTAPGPLWIHLDRTRPRAQEWLRESSGLDAVTSEALLAEFTRPRATERDKGLLIILRGVNMNPGAEPDELISIRAWVDHRRIITLRQHRFQTVRDLRRRAQHGSAPDSPLDVLAAIAAGLTARLGPVVENLQTMIDASEEAIADGQLDAVDAHELAIVRRQAISLRRYLAPQRDTLMGLMLSPGVEGRVRSELHESADRTARIVEDLEEVRDRAAVTQEELRAQRELRAGRTMYVLTLVAAIFLPLSFVTGLLGINVGGIPGTDHPSAFWIVCLALCACGGAIVWLFRRLRWI
jgi:zinc transporter